MAVPADPPGHCRATPPQAASQSPRLGQVSVELQVTLRHGHTGAAYVQGVEALQARLPAILGHGCRRPQLWWQGIMNTKTATPGRPSPPMMATAHCCSYQQGQAAWKPYRHKGHVGKTTMLPAREQELLVAPSHHHLLKLGPHTWQLRLAVVQRGDRTVPLEGGLIICKAAGSSHPIAAGQYHASLLVIVPRLASQRQQRSGAVSLSRGRGTALGARSTMSQRTVISSYRALPGQA